MPFRKMDTRGLLGSLANSAKLGLTQPKSHCIPEKDICFLQKLLTATFVEENKNLHLFDTHRILEFHLKRTLAMGFPTF